MKDSFRIKLLTHFLTLTPIASFSVKEKKEKEKSEIIWQTCTPVFLVSSKRYRQTYKHTLTKYITNYKSKEPS